MALPVKGEKYLFHIMNDFPDLIVKYLDKKVQIAVNTAEMNEIYSMMLCGVKNCEQLDEICLGKLKTLQKQLDESEFEAGAGQCDFIPDVPVWKAKMMLKDAAELVLYLHECKHLPQSFPLAREIILKMK